MARTMVAMATELIVVFLLVLVLSTTKAISTAASMDATEKETLLQVMKSLSIERSWRSLDDDPCSSPWPGLECSSNGSVLHVTKLHVGAPPNPGCKKGATFPPLIFSLPFLQSLFLINCFKNGRTTLSFPPRRYPSLLQLSLKGNPALAGNIPPHVASFSSLQVLTISQCSLSGAIPVEIGGLSSLVHVDLSYNSLIGAIPTQIGELINLVGLDLSYNSFSSQIPATIGDLALLQKLDLSSNNLSGSVPETMTNLRSLSFLALSNNKISSHFSENLAKMESLQYLIMDNNPMFMPLPMQIGDVKSLQELRMANCGYSGGIPESIGRLEELTTLSLENNRLTGGIPEGLSELRRMYHLNLSRNNLDGAVPFDGTFLQRLGRNLDLSGNPGLCISRGDAEFVHDAGVGICGDHQDQEPDATPAAAAARCGVCCWEFAILGLLVFSM